MSFHWQREVPPDWQVDLDKLAPGDRVSRLVLGWLAGFPYEPVQRWAIWEVTPASAVAKILEDEHAAGITDSLLAGIWKDLRGPDPRTVGKWRPDKTLSYGKRWVSKSVVSRNQWDIHQQTGGLPMLCWIIEGVHGGHSWQFGPFERSFLLEVGTDPELVQEMANAWPNPGSQPYAEYDQRVFTALAERDLLRNWRQGMPWEDRSRRTHAGLILAGSSQSQRERTMDRMTKWLDNQISDAVSDIPRSLLPQWSDLATVNAPPDHEAAHESLYEE